MCNESLEDLTDWIKHRYANNYVWKQLNGHDICVNDISTAHLRNTIDMLEAADHDYSDCEILTNMKCELNWRTKC